MSNERMSVPVELEHQDALEKYGKTQGRSKAAEAAFRIVQSIINDPAIKPYLATTKPAKKASNKKK
jgi:hypothetical protein